MGTTGIVLPTEPANATIAGDVLIASLRVNEGRSTVAFSLATGKQLWKAPDAKTFVVRCEADTRAPCFAVRLGTGSDRIHRIDPQTGALGDVVYESERIEDVAIDQGGTHLVITSAQHHSFTDLDLTGASTTASRSVPLTSTRSVAIDYDGQVLATGTLVKNTYQAGHVAADGTWSVLAQTENDILSMIRPSVDGRRILLLSRNYSPWLYLVP
jgi:hypothetical protein